MASTEHGAERQEESAGASGRMAPRPMPPSVKAPATADRQEMLRILEALLFAATEPLDVRTLATRLPPGEDVPGLLLELQSSYDGRGVMLQRISGKWAFRTANDLGYLLQRQQQEERRLSRAALETLAIIAYHQPVTRAEIEEIRAVTTSKGTLDVLMETGWIRPRGRRRSPGRPLTYGTTDAFLRHFGFDTLGDLPGISELKGMGLLDANLPPGFSVPDPRDLAALQPDELPLDASGDEDAPDENAPDEEDAGEDATDEDATGHAAASQTDDGSREEE